MLDNLKKYKVILASNSPRRKELLSGLGVDYEIRTLPDVPNASHFETALGFYDGIRKQHPLGVFSWQKSKICTSAHFSIREDMPYKTEPHHVLPDWC